MIIFRYLFKEVMTTLVALTGILLFIFMSNQGVQYLNRAASGRFPGAFIMKLMMLEIPNLLGLLLPLGFYMSLMLAYGRLYADSEMTALSAGGYGVKHLLRDSLFMALGVSFFVAILVCFSGPWIAKERSALLRSTGLQVLIQTFSPGRFQSLQDGKIVFYVESMDKQSKKGQRVFLAKQDITQSPLSWQVLWAAEGALEQDKPSEEDYLVLKNGRAYIGVPGQANFKLARFDSYQLRLPHPVSKAEEDIRARSMSVLLANFQTNQKMAAELQWRLSIPVMVMMLTFVAVPLSRINPRSGKYANLLPALVIFIFYANLMFIARNWVGHTQHSIWLVFSLLHGSVGVIGLYLWRRQLRAGV